MTSTVASLCCDQCRCREIICCFVSESSDQTHASEIRQKFQFHHIGMEEYLLPPKRLLHSYPSLKLAVVKYSVNEGCVRIYAGV